MATYGYDAIDNLVYSQVTAGAKARTSNHNIDYSSNRLTSITSNVAGYSMVFEYDSQGNIRKRGTQPFVFDQANRLKTATGKAIAARRADTP